MRRYKRKHLTKSYPCSTAISVCDCSYFFVCSAFLCLPCLSKHALHVHRCYWLVVCTIGTWHNITYLWAAPLRSSARPCCMYIHMYLIYCQFVVSLEIRVNTGCWSNNSLQVRTNAELVGASPASPPRINLRRTAFRPEADDAMQGSGRSFSFPFSLGACQD